MLREKQQPETDGTLTQSGDGIRPAEEGEAWPRKEEEVEQGEGAKER